MNHHYVAPFIENLGVDLPSVDRFWKLGDLTGLRVRKDSSDGFYRANYERGMLLYALVEKYRPLSVLEFGTGRGYGCLCMAWSMENNAIPGRIYTIDMVAHDEKIEWPIDWGDGAGPTVARLSREDVWHKVVPKKWLDHIVELHGFSGQVMGKYQTRDVDMAFIDGGHGYEAVRSDFFSVLDVASDRFGVLFDDYGPHPGFGVKKFIDEEVAPYFHTSMVYTDRCWPGGERAGLADPGYGMIWIHADGLADSIDVLYPRGSRTSFLKACRRREVWLRARRFISKLARGGA